MLSIAICLREVTGKLKASVGVTRTVSSRNTCNKNILIYKGEASGINTAPSSSVQTINNSRKLGEMERLRASIAPRINTQDQPVCPGFMGGAYQQTGFNDDG
eukprot:993195-Prorocentrum_minimum.AAC.3